MGLLGAGGGTARPYSPWIFSIYMLLSAILFWIFKKCGTLKIIENK
jgi:hypothetical protein